MKRQIVTLACVMALALACGIFTKDAQAGTKKHTFKIVHTTLAAPSPPRDAIDEMAERVTKGTDGRITFKIYGAELADYLEVNEMVMRGEVDILWDAISTNFEPRFAAMQFPYLVTDYGQAAQVHGPDGFMSNLFRKIADDNGMVWLGTWVQGLTGLSLNHAVTTPEEAKGVKIRSTPVGLIKDVYRNIGFDVAIIPYNEVPTAITTGVVEGQAGGGPAQTWNLVRDINKFYIHDRSNMETWGVIMNKDSWNSLEEDDQKLIQGIINEILIRRFSEAEADEKAYMKKLTDHGLTVIDLGDYPEKLAVYTELGRKTWPMMEEIIGKEAMDTIVNSLKK